MSCSGDSMREPWHLALEMRTAPSDTTLNTCYWEYAVDEKPTGVLLRSLTVRRTVETPSGLATCWLCPYKAWRSLMEKLRVENLSSEYVCILSVIHQRKRIIYHTQPPPPFVLDLTVRCNYLLCDHLGWCLIQCRWVSHLNVTGALGFISVFFILLYIMVHCD